MKPAPNPQAEALARLALQVLDTQQEYFRSRATEKLHESKALEKRLRDAAKAVLSPPQVQPALFGETA
jgi:hypothetical protein